MDDAEPEGTLVWPPSQIRLLRVMLFIHFALNLLIGGGLWLLLVGMVGFTGGDILTQADIVGLNLMFLLYAAPTLPLTFRAGTLMARRPSRAKTLLNATWVIAAIQASIVLFILFWPGWFYSYSLISLMICVPILLIEISLAAQYDSKEWLRRTSWKPPY